MALTENEKDQIRKMLASPFAQNLKDFSLKTDEQALMTLTVWKEEKITNIKNRIEILQKELESLQ
jgi:hypothetical protein